MILLCWFARTINGQIVGIISKIILASKETFFFFLYEGGMGTVKFEDRPRGK